MKVLVLYDYPAGPGGLATQGDLLYRGLLEIGVDACAVNYAANEEKEWYYRWFKPDVAVGIGYWGHTPQIVLHPQRHGIPAVPWLVADGFIANYQDVLNSLPLILLTSRWVKDVYIRDGIREDILDVLPVGCNTDLFVPRALAEPRVAAIREGLGITPDQLMILTVGGDAASKGAREMMAALADLPRDVGYDWRYVCKVWPQERTLRQNEADIELAEHLGLADRVCYCTDIMSRNIMPYLMNACDIYAAPSRLEGFGMPQVEAGACGKPVISIKAMGMLDTLVDGETACLARVAEEHYVNETVVGPEAGYEPGHRIVFDRPRIADYKADVGDLTAGAGRLLTDPGLRRRMGAAGRARVVQHFDYRVVARRFVQLVSDRLGLS